MNCSTRILRDGARYRALCLNERFSAGLVHYPAGVEHEDHQHDRAQLTFLLAGGFSEQAEGRDTMPQGPRHGYRRSGARHGCTFGTEGALILSVNFLEEADLPIDPSEWRHSGRATAALLPLLYDPDNEPEVIVEELLATVGLEARVSDGYAPPWLARVAEQFADDPSVEVARAAQEAGVHRVHLSRAFQRYFGVSPSAFRLQCKTARAIRLMVEHGEAPAAASVGGGFADQAHFARTAKVVSGLPPARLRRLLAA